MDDYISREAAMSMPLANGQYDHENANEHFIYGCESYKEWLEQIPAADVRPAMRGEWLNSHPQSPMFDGGGPPYCSVCGEEVPLRSVEVNQWKLERGRLSGPEVVYKTKYFFSKFCPNCGADMREVKADG